MRIVLSTVLCVSLGVPAYAQNAPSLVPAGWRQEFADAQTKTRRFVSPDGRSSLTSRQSSANRGDLVAEMDEISHHPHEEITYQRRGSSWIAVSGYRGDQIFYRKSNLACGGKSWHHIELLYPRAQKKQMDQTVTYIARAMTKYRSDW
jgi:hypothetical protein